MEIILLFVGWLILLYVIYLNRELSAYRKFHSQHDDIYVPSYNEIVNQNRALQVIRFLFNQFNSTKGNKIFRIVFPYVRKKISIVNPLTIWGKKID